MDKKAKQILYKYYWKNGWINENERFISEEDYHYACSKGIMFPLEPERISHDDCIYKIKELLNQCSKQMAVDLFVSSLSTRRVYSRSILSSYVQAEKLKVHNFVSREFYCEICQNFSLNSSTIEIDIDRNVMNFEKSKWGGVRLNNLEYILFDLEQIQKFEITKPTNADNQILYKIFDCINQCKPKDAPRQLEQYLKKVLPSSKTERDVLIEILAAVNILIPAKVRPTRGKGTDFGYVEDWRGEDGCNLNVTKTLFGKYIYKDK